ncbi:MAG: FtsX-like permease family protein [Pseudomonadota bacterium]|uniref:cell division protein FtsX n=1 Tax=Rhodovulum sp. FJ3 TaxID=3079053 RepID=UPI000C09B8F4|nr:FtsX-like permease family protein [Rhodovulum sp. FJ3]MAY31742.1 cell division protein FtsX [Rhodovulum sp.]MDV4169487.1 cell division protein FtsX [Rhodovulum sp. FJ3]MEE3316521.1 FtsX-like permease family protein [Pseudomonadota bacterium]
MKFISRLADILPGDTRADRVVPPSGFTVGLTVFTAGAMAFLAVFALALSLASGRLADRWSDALARTATIRISAPEGQMQAQTDAVMAVLVTTPGIADARVLTVEEQRVLLLPWFGPDLPVEELPLPQLIELIEDDTGFDGDSLRLRLAGEAPGAVLDDHTRWRRPLVAAAGRLRLLGWISIVLIGATTAAMITLSANAALAANERVIRTLRLVGARDLYIARAFVRRFTGRAIQGAVIGTALGVLAVALLPSDQSAGGFLTGLGFQGWTWLWPLGIPVLAALVAYGATRAAALRVLRGYT